MLRRRRDYRTIVVSLVIIAVTVILCSVEDVTFAQLSAGRENLFDDPLLYVIRQAGNLFSIVCCMIVLAYLSGLLEKDDLREELKYLQYNAAQMKQQYEISKDTIEQINIKCHDMRHKVRGMLTGGTSDGALEQELPRSDKHLRREYPHGQQDDRRHSDGKEPVLRKSTA